MKVLVTGSNGFIGRNLIWNLREIRDGKNLTRPGLTITGLYEYDMGGIQEELENACENCDFVFLLASGNQSRNESEFTEVNCGFFSVLLNALKSQGNACPVLFAGSVQEVSAKGFRDYDNKEGRRSEEELLFQYAQETGAKVLIYRLPDLFGKWCEPDRDSVVAAFCNAMANDLEYTVDNPDAELELVYIDDLINEMLDALEGKEHRCEHTRDAIRNGSEVADFKVHDCHVPVAHRVTLGEITDLLHSFRQIPQTLRIPELPKGSFAAKLCSTYLSYLPPAKMSYDFQSNVDSRGQFTELFRMSGCGQVSVNVVKPGRTKGEHWHNSKWEIFIVVSGHGLIRQRRIGVDPKTGREYPMTELEVTGAQMKAVQMLPGYTHSITNLSEQEELVTLMWASETFDAGHPDTFHEPVL